MSDIRAQVRTLTHPVITDRGQLSRYVVATTLTCIAIALSFDVVNQLVFFDGWPATLRSWTVTVLVALVISAPISSIIGRAHLELYRAKREADILSRTDPLTGLPNRRAIFEMTEKMKHSAMILVILDLDRFKRVNDTHGHLVGDEVIVMFAHLLRDAVGSLGEVGRIGGEEFMLVAAPENVERLAAMLTTLRERLAGTAGVFQGQRVSVTVSAGVACSDASGDVNAVYREADHALYLAKTLGRNRIVFAPSFERLRNLPPSHDEAMWRHDADSDRTDGTEFTSVA